MLPLAVAAALGVGLPSAALAQSFPAEIELSALDGTNGFVLNGEAASDRSGFAVSAAGDINGDGIDDLIIGAYGADPNGNSLAGRSYVVFGSDTGFATPFELSGLDGSNGVLINGEAAYDFSGYSVSAAGDINGDGIDDLIIGANGADPNGSFSGRSYVVFGSGTGFTSPVELSSLDGSNGVEFNGEAAGDNAGFSVGAAGDINGDGIGDLIIGAPDADPNGSLSGRSYVVFGSGAGLTSPVELSSLDGSNGVEFNGEAAGDFAGFSVGAAGDINGDGIGDLIIGAPDAATDGIASGRSYVVFGSDTGLASPVELSSLNGNSSNGVVFIGEADGDKAGFSVSAAGDINGDGIDDLIIGAYRADVGGIEAAGRSYVVFGSATGLPTPFDLSALNGSNGFVLNGEMAGDRSGRSVSAAGDINGDGIDDLIIGADRADPNGTNSGRSYVVFGSATGLSTPFDLSTLNGSNGFVLNGEAELDYSGFSVSAAGDINGDGIDDLIIGAPGASNNSGRSYVVFGRSSRDLAVSKSNGAAFVDTGLPTTWFIDVANVGAADIAGATLSDPVPTGVTGATWTCTAFGGAACANPSGSGAISENVDLPAGASLMYEFTATVTAKEGDSVTNTATITLAAGETDANPADNSATDTDPVGLFIDGFETE